MQTDVSRAWPLLSLLLIAAVIVLGERASAPPAPLPADAPVGRFSAMRAMATVEWMAQAPRPAGSAAHARVADRLAETLGELGGDVERQRRLQTFDYDRHGGDARFAMVDNIVARWPGSVDGPALLLMSHHDSSPAAPGAGDAASGVATIIETVRALRAGGQPLRNPLIVLFSDGEETGLFGAQAFFDHHPWAADVGMVLNFDARGSRGPVAMFETSRDNGALIGALDGSPAPLANSLVYSIYRQMPNDTDLSIAKAAGKAGMNFAFVDGFFDYHRPTDTPANLSAATVQHLGSHALTLARHFGSTPLPPAAQPDRHYFNPFGHLFVHYPPWVDWLAWLLGGSMLLVAAWRRRTRAPTPGAGTGTRLRALLAAPLVLLLPLLALSAVQRLLIPEVTEVIARLRWWWLGWSLLAAGIAILLHAGLQRGIPLRATAVAATLLIALLLAGGASWPWLMAALVCAAGMLLLRRPVDAHRLWSAGMALWWLLAAALLWRLPGAAHVLVWPLLPLALLHAIDATRETPAAWRVLLATVPAMLLLGATAATFQLLIGFQLPVAPALPLLLVLVALAPVWVRTAVPLGAGVSAAGLLALAVLASTSPWNARTPRGVELFLLRDADGASAWASSDVDLLDWHHARLGDAPQRATMAAVRPDSDTLLWRTPAAAVVAMPAPRIELLEAVEHADRRRLRLRLSVDGPNEQIALYLPPDLALQRWSVDGQPLRVATLPAGRWRRLLGFALPPGGVELQLEFGAKGEWPEAVVSSVHFGLPDGMALPPRPPELMRRPFSHADSSVAVARIRLGPAD